MKKILIVDDEPNIVMTLEYTFKKNNFEVFIARDGQEALDILENQLPDIIILDVMMPGVLSGLHVCRALKSRPLPPKVILLSARGRSEDLDAGMRAGAEAYLVKPFGPMQLIESIGQELAAA